MGSFEELGDTHMCVCFELRAVNGSPALQCWVSGLEYPPCPGGTAGPLIDGTSEDLKTCQLTSQLLSLALRLENAISDSSSPTLSS